MKKQDAMSRAEAAYILLQMAGGEISVKQCEALQTAVRNLVKRHFDCKKNKARWKDKAINKMHLDGAANKEDGK